VDAIDQQLLVDALAFALEAHGDQTRKGKPVPYVSHLLRVAGMVLDQGGSASQASVGLLHDVIEDCEVEEKDLSERFGEEIAGSVRALSDVLPGDSAFAKSPWLERKQHYLESLARTGPWTRLVAGCDKVDNLRAIVADLEFEGLDTLTRFTATPAQTRWYFESVRSLIGQDLPRALLDDFDRLLERLEVFVHEASPEG
jgi:(p)ppGpp synthase/HD superfamily hydrolase